MRADLKRLKRDFDSAGSGVTQRVQPAAPVTAVNTAVPRPSARPSRGLALAAAVLAGVAILFYLLRPGLPPPHMLGAVRITADGRDKEPVFTDGSRIYFSSCTPVGCSLYQAPAAGGDPIPIETPLPNPYLADVSPSLSAMLVVSCPDFRKSIRTCPLWMQPVLGGSPRRVGHVVGMASFTPDSKGILSVDRNSIYRTKLDGSEPVKLLTLAGNDVPNYVRLSPDGRRLRFTVIGGNRLSIWEAAADGSNPHPLIKDAYFGFWSSDNKYFVFNAIHGGVRNVWAIREGSSLLHKISHESVQITSGPTDTFGAAFSVDGRKLFASTMQPRAELVRYDLATHDFAPYLSGISAMSPQFPPGAKSVAYVSYPEGTLWRNKLQLTFPPMFVLQPRWSPDGSKIAFMARQPGHVWNVYVVGADGGTPDQPLPGDHPGSRSHVVA